MGIQMESSMLRMFQNIYSKVHENVLRILNWILKNKFLINKYVQIQHFYLFTHKFTYTILYVQ